MISNERLADLNWENLSSAELRDLVAEVKSNRQFSQAIDTPVASVAKQPESHEDLLTVLAEELDLDEPGSESGYIVVRENIRSLKRESNRFREMQRLHRENTTSTASILAVLEFDGLKACLNGESTEYPSDEANLYPPNPLDPLGKIQPKDSGSAVDHPKHYNSHPSGVECIEIVRGLGFCLGNAAKYIFRAGLKGPAAEDLKKAIWYLDCERTNLTTEWWDKFPGDPRYEVSTLGQVRWAATGRLRKLVPTKGGYLTFLTMVEGRAVLRYVHRTVAETFIGPLPNGRKNPVCHRDRNKANNRVSNLKIDTVSGNLRDRRRHGTHFFGEQDPMAKLTPDQVAQIRASDERPRALAQKFGVARATIERILKGISWQDPRLECDKAFDRYLAFEPEGNIRFAMVAIWTSRKMTNDPVEDVDSAKRFIQAEIDLRGAK